MSRRAYDGPPLDGTYQHITERPALDDEAEDVVYATDPEAGGEERTEAVDVGGELYHGVLEAADYQTGGPRTLFPAGVSRETLVNAGRSGSTHSVAAVRSAVDAAVARDDLLQWEDRSGVRRYTPTDETSLRELVATQNARDEPRVALIERVAEILGGGDGE